ncbi:hypothetical protein [Aurantiacibacter spongiae]|nr:hypothetical protein [Aurantiacibacter spongiae]
MTRALALTRSLSANGLEYARVAIVSACAATLIAAGQALPF